MERVGGHQKILEKILFEKDLSKRELAKMIGYTEQNSSKTFNKKTYTKKMVEKISTALGVEPSVFHVHAPITQLGNGNTASVSVGERELYERLLKEKDNRIAHLERLLEDTK